MLIWPLIHLLLLYPTTNYTLLLLLVIRIKCCTAFYFTNSGFVEYSLTHRTSSQFNNATILYNTLFCGQVFFFTFNNKCRSSISLFLISTLIYCHISTVVQLTGFPSYHQFLRPLTPKDFWTSSERQMTIRLNCRDNL